MNLLYIGKYPPLEGGVGAAAFWRIKELRARGYNIDILTAKNKSEIYVSEFNTDDQKYHLIQSKSCWHIPYSPLLLERMVSYGLKLVSNNKFDCIEGNYIFPFGIAAWMLSKITGIPFVLRHAGSDIWRVYNPELEDIFKQIIKDTTRIITYEESLPFWNALNTPKGKLFISKHYAPSKEFWNAGCLKQEKAVFFHKLTPKWNWAQLDFFGSKLKQQGYKGYVECYCVGESDEMFMNVKKVFGKYGLSAHFHEFVSPDRVPNILKDTKYILVSNVPSNIPEMPNLLFEGLASGCNVLLDSENFNLDIINFKTKELSVNYEAYIKNQMEIYNF